MIRTLVITLSVEDKVVGIAKGIKLQPCSTSTARTFKFEDIEFRLGFELNCRENILIRVFIPTNYGSFNRLCKYEFNLIALDFDPLFLSLNDLNIRGIVNTTNEEEYEQCIIDVFNTWQRNEMINWFELSIYSFSKEHYIIACLYYSGISKSIKQKVIYTIDMSLVKVELDFIYLVSLEFLGDKGYMGYDFFTFKDCILTLFKSKAFPSNPKILFLNSNKIFNSEITELFTQIKALFSKYKFEIETN